MRPPDKRTPAPGSGSGGSGNIVKGSDDGAQHTARRPVAQQRERLPNRRPSQTFDLEFGGQQLAVTIGYRPGTGEIAEVFARLGKPGSELDLLLDDLGVLLSLLLQHGVLPTDLAHSVGRDHGQPASVAGALIDLLAKQEVGR